jgi:hypothetical protein
MIDKIEQARKEQKARIYSAFKEATQPKQTATLITKAEFEEQYPETQFERYSLKSVSAFRDEINKSETVENKDEAFKAATKDLKHFMVQSGGKHVIMFVRKKQAGE